MWRFNNAIEIKFYKKTSDRFSGLPDSKERKMCVADSGVNILVQKSPTDTYRLSYCPMSCQQEASVQWLLPFPPLCAQGKKNSCIYQLLKKAKRRGAQFKEDQLITTLVTP
jgi:hypothetical protein